jgi:hypothetical protein
MVEHQNGTVPEIELNVAGVEGIETVAVFALELKLARESGSC